MALPFLLLLSLTIGTTFAESLSCKKFDQENGDYRGFVNVTYTGIECQAWSSMFPHSHEYTPEMYPDAGLEKNYCRSPDHEAGDQVWCYTTDIDTRWEYCSVPICSCPERAVEDDPLEKVVETEMCSDGDQRSYRGPLNHTIDGRGCQAWGSMSPHCHENTRSGYPDAGLSGNYCRNPDGDSQGVWCYTLDSEERWGYCSLPACTAGKLIRFTGATSRTFASGTHDRSALQVIDGQYQETNYYHSKADSNPEWLRLELAPDQRVDQVSVVNRWTDWDVVRDRIFGTTITLIGSQTNTTCGKISKHTPQIQLKENQIGFTVSCPPTDTPPRAIFLYDDEVESAYDGKKIVMNIAEVSGYQYNNLGEWAPIPRSHTWVTWHLDSRPLQLKMNEEETQLETGLVLIYLGDDPEKVSARGIHLDFSKSPIEYSLGPLRSPCTGDIASPPPVPAEPEKIWTIAKTAEEITISCNGVLLQRYLFADQDKEYAACDWEGKSVEWLMFRDASLNKKIYYRTLPMLGPDERNTDRLWDKPILISHAVMSSQYVTGWHGVENAFDGDRSTFAMADRFAFWDFYIADSMANYIVKGLSLDLVDWLMEGVTGSVTAMIARYADDNIWTLCTQFQLVPDITRYRLHCRAPFTLGSDSVMHLDVQSDAAFAIREIKLYGEPTDSKTSEFVSEPPEEEDISDYLLFRFSHDYELLSVEC